MIDPWRAVCMQVYTHILNRVDNRHDAMEIVNKSLLRWSELVSSLPKSGDKMLILFPEFSLQGFPIHENTEEWIKKACFEIPGPETEKIQNMAQNNKCFIGANSYEKDKDWPGRYFNTSYLIDDSGEIILKYRRINTVHACSPHDILDQYLDKYGIEGMFPVVKTCLGNISMMPCGEIMFPEASRALAFRGAEVILHPTSDYGADDNWSWQSAKKVRASENMLYLISSNSAGMPDALRGIYDIAGGSKIFDWEGRVLSQGPSPGESLRCSALIDVEALRKVRNKSSGFNRLAQARPEAYKKIYDNSHFYPVNSFSKKPMISKSDVNENLKKSIDILKKK